MLPDTSLNWIRTSAFLSLVAEKHHSCIDKWILSIFIRCGYVAFFSSHYHSKMLLKSGLGFAAYALFSVKKDSAQESFAITYDPLRWFPENEAIFCDSHNDAILDKHD